MQKFIVLLSLFFSSYSAFVYAKPPIQVIAYQTELVEVPQSLHALGQLKAIDSVNLAFNVSDKLSKIYVQSGQKVAQGQLLFELNQIEEQAKLEQSIALEKEALAQYKRVKKAMSRTSVTQSLVDEKYREWQTAIAQRKISSAMLEERKLYAPFGGTLGLMNLSVGQLVESGQNLVSLDNSQTMQVEFFVPSRYLANIRPGLIVNIQSDAFTQKTFTGQISAISPRIESHSRMVQVQANIDNSELLLKTNMLVEANIELPVTKQLQVPNSALLMLGDKEFIYRLTAAKNPESETTTYKAEKVQVKVGQISAKNSEILTGLNVDDIVVSQGVMRVNNKVKIHIKAIQNGTSQTDLLKPNR